MDERPTTLATRFGWFALGHFLISIVLTALFVCVIGPLAAVVMDGAPEWTASALLAGLGWTWACDVLALNKAEHTAVITLPGDIFTDQERDVEKTGADGEKLTVTETVPTADMNYVADLL